MALSHSEQPMQRTSVKDCKVLPLMKIHNRAGNITIIEGNKDVPFDIKRIYYLYDIPGGEERGGHAHKELFQLIVAASGAFDVLLDDGKNKKSVTLNRPDFGLIVTSHRGPFVWYFPLRFTVRAIISGIMMTLISVYKSDHNQDFLKVKIFEEILQ